MKRGQVNVLKYERIVRISDIIISQLPLLVTALKSV